MNMRIIAKELQAHAPFTALGTLTGFAILMVIVYFRLPNYLAEQLFWTLHPLHVLLSALTTAAMYRLHSANSFWKTVLIAYLGSIGIATLSDCIIPFLGESILALPNRGLHIGPIEKWYLVNPLALLGVTFGYLRPRTKLPHMGHVLLSTWASLFHITMAMGDQFSLSIMVPISIFLFLAVWVPCCTSDIIFPLLFTPKSE